jgi:transposase InsO family protein
MSEAEYQLYTKRLQIVELILEASVDPLSKKQLREQFCLDNSVSERTIHNWLSRYLKDGPRGLVFLHRRERSLRIADAELRSKVLELVHELPSRSVARLRRLVSVDEAMSDKIAKVSDRSIYRFLHENGLGQKQRQGMLVETNLRAHRQFEAPHAMALVQADARDGIWLELPEGRRAKTYLFVWIDDFSRKILFGKYYLEEKLPCLEDSFKSMVLRWGIPTTIYMDNGSVYISRQFGSVLAELRIKQLHHKPYQAQAKGKVEALQKTIKNEFQSEASRAGIRTVEELNSAFWAWAEMEYNKRLHSATGQAPDERFLQGLPKDHRRVEDLGRFQAMFLWKQKRTVTKWAKISLHANHYPVQSRPPGTVVEVRYDPFDLSQVLIYDLQSQTPLETSCPTKQINLRAPHVPEESKKSGPEVSAQSVAYFSRLRQKYSQAQSAAQEVSFLPLLPAQEHEDE